MWTFSSVLFQVQDLYEECRHTETSPVYLRDPNKGRVTPEISRKEVSEGQSLLHISQPVCLHEYSPLIMEY